MKFCKDCRHSCVYPNYGMKCMRPELVELYLDTGEVRHGLLPTCRFERGKLNQDMLEVFAAEGRSHCGKEAKHFEPRRVPRLDRFTDLAIVLAFLAVVAATFVWMSR